MHVITETWEEKRALIKVGITTEEKLQNRCKEKSKNKKYSLVRGVVGIIGRRVFVLSVHIITGERILNHMDSKQQHIMRRRRLSVSVSLDKSQRALFTSPLHS